MSNTPLSDHITRLLSSDGRNDLARFHAAFLDAVVGVTIHDPPDVPPGTAIDGGGLNMPVFRAPNGLSVIRACADPDVFVERYDPDVNARMNGREVLGMAVKLGPDCGGVLVASAASEHSILIPHEDIPTLLSPDFRPPRPWWKFW